MSDVLLLAIIAFIPPLAALPPTLVALAVFRQGRNIHALVNSRFTAMVQELADARKEIVALKQLLADRIKGDTNVENETRT